MIDFKEHGIRLTYESYDMIRKGFHIRDIVVIVTWSVSESKTKKKQRLHVYGFTVHPVGILYIGHHLSFFIK